MSVEDFDDYQIAAASTAIYPNRKEMGGLAYAALGLTSEAGEVAGKVKKLLRDEGGEISEERREQVLDELSDVLWYVAEVASNLDEKLSLVAERNVTKLFDRKTRGVLGGNGDKR